MVPILGVPGTSISNLKTRVDMSPFHNRTCISPVKPCDPIPYLAVEPGMKQRPAQNTLNYSRPLHGSRQNISIRGSQYWVFEGTN